LTLERLSLQSVPLTSELAFSIIAASASLRKIQNMHKITGMPFDKEKY
jgi:hypothetical protein